MNRIPIKFISKDEAIRLGLTKPSGMGAPDLLYSAVTDIATGEKKEIRVENMKTKKKQIIFKDGKKFKLDEEFLNTPDV